jgi:hypothetical protein
VSKWLGVTAGLSSLALIHASARRVCAARRALAITGAAALLLLTFRHYSFWVRPDPLQLFCSALALFCAGGRSGAASVVAAGVTSGLLWNLRITGALYSLPVLALVWQRAGARATCAVIGIALAVAAAPFLLEGVSLANYLTWIRLSSQTGLTFPLLRQNMEFAICFALPLLLAGWLTDRGGSGDQSIVRALGLGMLFVAIAGSKPGAGPYHLIPFVPAIAWVVANRIGRGLLSVKRPLAVEAAVALLVVLTLLGAAQATQLVSTMAPRRARGDVEDLHTLLAKLPGTPSVEMGYGHTEAHSLLRPIVTFRTNGYFIDQPAVREQQLQGLEVPAATVEAVRGCRVAYWLVPRNEQPFSGVNDYPAVLMRPLYPAKLRDAFAAAYRLVETTQYFDVWRCSGG